MYKQELILVLVKNTIIETFELDVDVQKYSHLERSLGDKASREKQATGRLGWKGCASRREAKSLEGALSERVD